MYVAYMDGKAVHATHLIEVKSELSKELCSLIGHSNDNKNILSFSKEQTSEYMRYFKQHGIDYKITPLSVGKNVAEFDDYCFQNYSEICDHLHNRAIPEKEITKKLERRIEVLEKQVAVLMKKMNIKTKK